jgi:hypothetical protein
MIRDYGAAHQRRALLFFGIGVSRDRNSIDPLQRSFEDSREIPLQIISRLESLNRLESHANSAGEPNSGNEKGFRSIGKEKAPAIGTERDREHERTCEGTAGAGDLNAQRALYSVHRHCQTDLQVSYAIERLISLRGPFAC